MEGAKEKLARMNMIDINWVDLVLIILETPFIVFLQCVQIRTMSYTNKQQVLYQQNKEGKTEWQVEIGTESVKFLNSAVQKLDT